MHKHKKSTNWMQIKFRLLYSCKVASGYINKDHPDVYNYNGFGKRVLQKSGCGWWVHRYIRCWVNFFSFLNETFLIRGERRIIKRGKVEITVVVQFKDLSCSLNYALLQVPIFHWDDYS